MTEILRRLLWNFHNVLIPHPLLSMYLSLPIMRFIFVGLVKFLCTSFAFFKTTFTCGRQVSTVENLWPKYGHCIKDFSQTCLHNVTHITTGVSMEIPKEMQTL